MLNIDRATSFKERVKHERELEIVQAAREVFADEGYDKTSIDTIAERVGIGKGTVYLHFPSKEALLLATLRQGTRDVVERCREQLPARAGVLDKLEAILNVLVEHRYANERLIRAVSFEIPAVLAHKEKAAAISELKDLIVGLVEEGQRDGLLAPGVDPQLGAIAMLALVFVCPTHLDPIPKQQLLQCAKQMYFHGITKEAKA